MTGTRSSFVLLVIMLSHALSLTPAHAQEKSGGDATPRQRAEELAREASKRFTEILSDETRNKVAEGAGQDSGAAGGSLNPIWDWLGQASRAYRSVIITKLKNPSGKVAILVPPGGAAPKLPMTPATSEVAREPEPRLGWTYLVESVREWLARANRSYRTEVVKKLVKPQPGTQSPTAEASPELEAAAQPEKAAPPQMAAAPQADAAGAATSSTEPKSDETRKAEVEAAAKRKAEAEARRKAEVEAAAKRKAEAEAKRKEVEAAAKRKAEAEAERKAEVEAAAKRKAEAEAKRKAEAEARRKDEAEAKRLAEEVEAEEKAVAEAKRMAAAMPKEPQVTVDRTVIPAPPERKEPAPADRSVPKARSETVVSEPPPPPEAKGAKKSTSKRHYRKRRLSRHARAHRVHRAHRRHRYAHCHRRRHCGKRHRHRRGAVRGWSGRIHVVRRGDTLTKIARRYYGTAAGYRRIYRANRRKVRNPNLIYPRQRLYIP